jgi:DNA-directed RNA polymerase specialized sigma subunit
MIQHLGKTETLGEQEILHRERIEIAFGALRQLEREVVTMMVLGEQNINEVGAWMGYSSPYRGRQAALELLRTAAGKIMSAWLTMDRNG